MCALWIKLWRVMVLGKQLHVMIVGLRGIPEVEGGIETHVQSLAPRLVDLGCRVEVVGRSPYVRGADGKTAIRNWKGVKITAIPAPRSTSFETLIHTFLAVLYAGWKRPDILHIHAIGPALFVPLARLLGLRVVITHHGSDYKREKWGRFASSMLRAGERFGMRMSQQSIVISRAIQSEMRELYNKSGTLIPNGVDIPEMSKPGKFLASLGVQQGRYIIMVSRFVSEKRQLDLIEAFKLLSLENWKLVLVGSLDTGDEYIEQVKAAAEATENVLLSGFQSGRNLEELYSNAGVFVLPSSHEGLPIALLEALSYGLRSLASDIDANLEVGLGEHNYFPLGDTAVMARRLQALAQSAWSTEQIAAQRNWVAKNYNWDAIAEQTLQVYRNV